MLDYQFTEIMAEEQRARIERLDLARKEEARTLMRASRGGVRKTLASLLLRLAALVDRDAVRQPVVVRHSWEA